MASHPYFLVGKERGLGRANDNAQAAGSFQHTEVEQQLLQLLDLQGRRHHVHLVAVDVLSQIAIFVRLLAVGLPFDDRLSLQFGPLHIVIARHEVDHLSAQASGQLLDQVLFSVDIAAVADQATQSHTARFGKLHNSLADIIGRVHGHHFARADDVDLLRLAFANRHGKSTTDDVAQHVIEDIVELLVVVVGPKLLQQIDRGDDPPAGTADTRFRDLPIRCRDCP